jgi:hypothetical protein
MIENDLDHTAALILFFFFLFFIWVTWNDVDCYMHKLCIPETRLAPCSSLYFGIICNNWWNLLEKQIWGISSLNDIMLMVHNVYWVLGWCRDNHMLLQLLLLLAAHSWIPGFSNLPMWNMRGLVILFLLHTGPVEFLYYWMHRAFHSEPLFQRYHSLHHLSVVIEPPTGQLLYSRPNWLGVADVDQFMSTVFRPNAVVVHWSP